MSHENAGYKRPPKDHQFTAGNSGNPKGRPKGTRNLRTDLAQMMKKPVVVRENGKPRRITRQQAIILSLYDKAVHGEVRAAASIMNMIMKQEPTRTDKSSSEFVTETDRLIIEDFLRRNGIGNKEPGDDNSAA